MSSFYDDASLVVIPSGYKTSKVYAEKPTDGSGDLAFTRTGDTATRVASNGLIERVRTNLLVQSNTFSTTWFATSASVTSGQAGYDGTNNAWLLSKSAANGNIAQSPASSGSETISIYAKAGTDNWLHILVRDSALVFFGGYFDLQNGVVGSAVGATTLKIESVGNGWYRCSASFVKSTTNFYRIYPAEGNNDTSGTSGNIYIQAAQLETGDIATQPILTTTAAVSVGPVANVPRLDYLGSTCPRLLLEPQRTNAILWSEQIDTTNWPASTRINVTANALISPDGYQNADLIIPNTTSGNHGPAQNVSGLTSGATYSFSIYAKAQGYSKFLILAGAGTGSGQYEFDLTAGTAQAGATITSVGNGWYRCTAPLVPNSSLLQYLIFISNGSSYSYTGNGTSGIAFWGAQVEAGTYATSYIPTLAASATRGADACSKTGISSLIGQTEGTIFLEVDAKVFSQMPISSEHRVTMVSDNTNNNRILLDFIVTSGGVRRIGVNVISGNVSQANLIFNTSFDKVYKIATAYNTNDFTLFVDGVERATDTSGVTFSGTTLSRLDVGQDRSGTLQQSNPIAQAILFPTRLTNDSLAELTSL